MAPTLDARSKSRGSKYGLTITSATVKKGHPTVVKYSWKYHDKSPTYFWVAVVEESSDGFYFLGDEVETRAHGGNGKGRGYASIDVLKDYPGKYVLVFGNFDETETVYATSKPFHVKRSDF